MKAKNTRDSLRTASGNACLAAFVVLLLADPHLLEGALNACKPHLKAATPSVALTYQRCEN